ncbi:LHS1 Heat shock protein 70 LHS1 [Candida maltosa Xu316]
MKGLLLISLFLSTALAAILGIDYGQQFTKAVLLAPGVPFDIVLTDEGKRKDTSGLCIRNLGKNDLERVFGSQMGSLITRFPGNSILDLKQLLGKSIDDPTVTQYLKNHFVKLIPDEGRNGIKFDLGFNNSTLEFTVEEILAMNLNEIKNRALNDLEANPQAAVLVEDVAVSIPPFATQATRQAYLDSLVLANFSNVLGLVEEGSAVALNYISNRKLEKEEYDNVKRYYLVYDAGAGSTTATLFSFTPISIGQSVLEIESIGFDESFGGKALTNSIYSLVLEKFLNHFNLEESDLTDKIAARLHEVSEKAKLVLSVNNEFHTTLETIFDDKDFKVSVTRQEFEDINSDLMEHISNPILKALEDAGLKVDDIESVILNGGSTRVPFIQKHITSLVGDNKISKSVNTDESAALGTTLRGLKWKTNSVSNKDILLVEKNYHNFEISINGQDDEIVVFPKNSPVGNTTKVNLGKLQDNELTISLYEDGKLIKSYNFDDISTRTKKLSCKSKEDKEIVAEFVLDDNKMFDIVKVDLVCGSKNGGSFFNKLLNKEAEEAEQGSDSDTTDNKNSNTTNSTKSTTSTTKKSKSVYVPIPKPVYPHTRPIGRVAKKTLFHKLAYLNAQDEIKIEADQIKNSLEAQCYQLRDYLDENEATLLEELSSDELEKIGQFVSEVVEWVDFESDDSSIEELKAKVGEVEEQFAHLKNIAEMTKADLSKEGIQKLFGDSSKLIMNIQSSMLEFGNKIAEMRTKYEDAGLDFEKENERIKQKLLGRGQDRMLSFEKNLGVYKDVLTEIGKVLEYNEKKFSQLSKQQLYSYHERLAKGVADMLGDIIAIETLHLERMELFESQFEKLLERKRQQEYRKKLREAQKAAKEPEEDDRVEIVEEDEEEEQVFDNEIPKQSPEESSESEPSAETEPEVEPEDVEHDEL